MKYRIKIVGFENGRTLYYPQAKKRWWPFWLHIWRDGSLSVVGNECHTDTEAKKCIEAHKSGNNKVSIIWSEKVK